MASSILPIAMLHHVSDRTDWRSLQPFVISRTTFFRFLDAIERSKLVTETFASQRQNISGAEGKKEVVITFDDCGEHLLDFVVPELMRRGMKAVFFVPTAHIGKSNAWDVKEGRSEVALMNHTQLLALQVFGMEIGGHSHHHIHLARVSDEQLEMEVSACQRELTALLGHSAISFAYPFGSIPSNLDVLKRNGFLNGCAIFSHSNTLLQRRRFIVHDGDTSQSLAFKLSRWYGMYRAFADRRQPSSALQ